MDKKFDWKKPIKANIFKLRILGLWPDGDDTYKVNLYTVWATICLLVFNLGPNIFQTANIYFISDDLEAVISNIFVMLSEFLSIIKAYYVVQNMRILKGLMVTLNCDLFQPRNAKQVKMVQPSIEFWKTNYVLYWSVTLGAVFFLSFYPILDKSGKEHQLPFMAWYPFDTTVSPVFEITYLYQIFGVTCSAATALCVDCLIAALHVYIGAQFDILSDNVEHLHDDSGDFDRKLIECVKHHKEIVRFAENTNTFSNWIILQQFFISAVSIGMTMFQLTMVTPLSSEFFSQISFLSSITTEIFMFCWYGNEVTIKSSKVPYALFQSQWIDAPLVAQKNMQFFVARCQKPVQMSALKLFYLSLDTFVSILRASWSYFALLNQVNQR
ncbi:hypothetical protein Zmor_007813 [Zophobas morio]|uniref:Odorant receptor n=1 Tax=Zophobas morio TaxID=2755281 RepID=A0AA38MPV2_9CUCU|nr:hypothetical protein Zmor_007813 [Zophobas morio]